MKKGSTATCQLAGRLGNNFFQIAHLIAYAKMYDIPYYIPEYVTQGGNGRVPLTVSSTGTKPTFTNIYNEPTKDVGSPFGGENPYFHHIDNIENVEFAGFYQSFKYFDWCRQDILDAFKFPYERIDKVSIHVRRTDYLMEQHAFPVLGLDFYGKAIEYFTTLGYKEFIVFSDDIAWCKEKFNRETFPEVESFQFSEGRTEIEDLVLMSNCAHNIVANSSFSFIAAWLNQNKEKIVVCNADKHLFKTYNMDMVPAYFKPIGDCVIKKLKLPNVTLFAIATKDGDVEKTAEALNYSMRDIEFAEVKLVSHYRPLNLHKDIKFEYVDKMGSIDDWNRYLFYNAWRHVDTEFGMLVHSDGYVVNVSSWRDDFLNYDYIGAPWPDVVARLIVGNDPNREAIRVGNSVGLRSRKLMLLPLKVGIKMSPSPNNDFNEDTQICVHHRNEFLKHGIKFADIDVAKYFSHEKPIPEIRNILPFAFHKHEGTNSIYPQF